jgi:hypothetical protein
LAKIAGEPLWLVLAGRCRPRGDRGVVRAPYVGRLPLAQAPFRIGPHRGAAFGLGLCLGGLFRGAPFGLGL